MDKELRGLFFALLRFELNGTPLCEEEKNLITNETLQALYKQAKRHDIGHLIADALDKMGVLLDGSKAKERFLQERNLAVYRYERLQYELDSIILRLGCVQAAI